jgi:hypothetical protein
MLDHVDVRINVLFQAGVTGRVCPCRPERCWYWMGVAAGFLPGAPQFAAALAGGEAAQRRLEAPLSVLCSSSDRRSFPRRRRPPWCAARIGRFRGKCMTFAISPRNSSQAKQTPTTGSGTCGEFPTACAGGSRGGGCPGPGSAGPRPGSGRVAEESERMAGR